MADVEDLETEVQSMLDSITDDEDHKIDPKKLELLKLQQAAQAPIEPVGPVVDISGVPEFKAPDAPAAPVVNLPPKGQDRVPQEPNQPPPPPVDLAQLSKAAVRPGGFSPEPVGPAKELDVTQRTDYISRVREPMRQELENNPALKLRVAALLSLENPGAGPAVVESMFNRAAYTGRSIQSITSLGPRSFYGPGRKPGLVESRMRELERNPRQLAQLLSLINQAYSSNVIQGHTDQGSKGDPNYEGGGVGVNINRERFNDWGGGPQGHAGARAWRANFQSKAGQPFTPIEELRPFMGSETMARTKPGLEGGLPTTPERAAEIAAVAKGTPIEKIKAITRVFAPKLGGQETVSRGTRVPTSRVSHTEQPQQTLPGTNIAPTTFPVPGMETSDFSMSTEATNPSLFSTIKGYQLQHSPTEAPAVKAPSETEAEKSFTTKVMDRVKSFMRPQTEEEANELRRQTLEGIKASTEGPAPDMGVWATDLGKGLATGVGHAPTDIWYGGKAFGQAAYGLLADDPEVQKYAFENAQKQQEWADWVRSKTGYDPTNITQSAGEFIGQNVGPKMGVNLALGAAAEYMAPTLQKWGESKPIPSLNPVSAAHAASVWGKPPVILNTPGGPVVANDAMLHSMVIGGGLFLGAGFAVGQSTKVGRYFRELPMFRDINTPLRELPYAPGTWAASTPRDVLKAATVNPIKAMLDVADRQERLQNPVRMHWYGNLAGISKEAANEAYQNIRVQTRTGAESLVSKVFTDGVLNTPDYSFKAPPLTRLHMFSEKFRQFPEYLRMQLIDNEINFNRQYNRGVPNAANTRMIQPRVPKDEVFMDHNGDRLTRSVVQSRITNYETEFPEFKKMFGEYKDNIRETRRFVSDGHLAPESMLEMMQLTVERPTQPIFSAGANSASMMKKLTGGANPLRILEDSMKNAILGRMDNHATATYINHSSQTAFTKRSSAWIKSQGRAAQEAGAVLERKIDGVKHYWTADPFLVSVMNNDNMATATFGRTFTSARRTFEEMSTRRGAPLFAGTALIRSIGQGWITAPTGVRSAGGRPILPAGPLSAAVGFAASATPRVLHTMVPTVEFWRDAINRTPAGPVMGRMLDVMARKMEQAYLNSFYHRMEAAGAYGKQGMGLLVSDGSEHITRAKAQVQDTHVRALLDYMLYSNNAWMKFTRGVGRNVVKKPWEAYGKTLETINEAANFGWAYKAGRKGSPTVNGRTIPDTELALMMREYTGDPAVRGSPHGLRFSGTPGQEKRAKAYANAGVEFERFKSATPWSGVLVQSPASTLAALRDNPMRANLGLVVGAVMPEIMSYLWNLQLGQEYINYQRDQRGDAKLAGNIYIGIPGQKPYRGLEIPYPQETIFPRAMAGAWMDQYYGRAISNMGTSVWDAFKAFLKGGVIPPMPPVVTGGLGLAGIVTPEGYAGGMRQRRPNEADISGQGESNIELAIRNMAPAIADVVLAAWHAGWENKEAKWGDVSLPSAAKGGLERLKSRAPVIGGKGRVAASSANTDELYEYQRDIDNLNARFAKWEKDQGAIDPNKGRGASPGGMSKIRPFMEGQMGKLPPSERGGKIDVEAPINATKNPLYNLFMKEMMKTYTQDAPDKGGIGFRSMWKNHDIYKKKLAAMNYVTENTAAQFVEKMRTKMPKTRKYLEDNGVNPYDYRDVRDFYANRSVQVQNLILKTIKATEQKFDKDPRIKKLIGGKTFSIKMLNPNSSGVETSD